MAALAAGFDTCKLFPAEAVGGIKLLQALAGPFADARFCPTGGITADNLLSFLRLPNVACVGGTWIAPDNLIRARAWDQITQLASEARALAASVEVKP